MKKIAFVFSLLFISAPAFAIGNFSGHWIATSGSASSTFGLHATCTRVEIEIVQTDGVLTTKKYKADCGTLGSDWGPVDETLTNGKVFENDEQVGTITEDTLLTTSMDSGVAYAYNLKLIPGENGTQVLESYYGVKNAVGAIVIEANLKKLP